jgi:hypothetical protein
MNESETIENKRKIRLISFIATVIAASTAACIAAFIDNNFLLFCVLVPCMITLSISIIPTSLSSKMILASVIVTCGISLITIIYAFATDHTKIMTALGFS